MLPGDHPSHGQAYQPEGGQHFVQTQTYAGQGWKAIEPVPLSPAEPTLQMARPSQPWKMYGRVVGLVILVFFFSQLFAGGIIEALMGDPVLGSLCLGFSIPFLLGMMAIRRPRIILLERAVPDQNGQMIHAITSHHGSLKTSIPTRMGRHMIRDDSILDVPTSKSSWILFTITILFAIGLGILSVLGAYIIVIPLIIPTVLIGFSIPVMGWWSHSTEKIGLPTRRRDAEAWLMAGMLSGIPAIMINSFFFPELISTSEFLVLSISAPVGEEICKGIAILVFASQIKSPKHGFQIGFTVGLGFAIVENLMYIASSSIDPIGFVFTTLVRGIGSIPGHAFWTSLTGAGLGWHLMQNRAQELHARANAGQRIEAPEHSTNEWKIFDPKTGVEVQREQPPGGGKHVLPSGVQVWMPKQAETIKEPWLKIPLPKHPVLGLILAIMGHAFWNGSSFGIGILAESMGYGEIGIILISLLWICILVVGVLLIGMGLMGSVRGAPDGSQLHQYQAELAEITAGN